MDEKRPISLMQRAGSKNSLGSPEGDMVSSPAVGGPRSSTLMPQSSMLALASPPNGVSSPVLNTSKLDSSDLPEGMTQAEFDERFDALLDELNFHDALRTKMLGLSNARKTELMKQNDVTKAMKAANSAAAPAAPGAGDRSLANSPVQDASASASPDRERGGFLGSLLRGTKGGNKDTAGAEESQGEKTPSYYIDKLQKYSCLLYVMDSTAKGPTERWSPNLWSNTCSPFVSP